MTTIQTINLGTYANDGTGDDLRTAFQKVNTNFTTLFGSIGIVDGANLGSGVGVLKDKNGVNLEFKTLTSTDSTITITPTDNTVNLTALTTLARDPSPTLNSNLNLNGHVIGDFGVMGGQIEARVWNYDIPLLSSTVELIARSAGIDFGANWQDATPGTRTDFGSAFAFTSPYANSLDFGSFLDRYSYGGGNSGGNIINNNSNQLMLNGNLTVNGTSITFTTPNISNLTLPASGTVAVLSNTLNQFATTTSSQLASVISDETGSGSLVFGTSPTITSPVVNGSIVLNGSTSGSITITAGNTPSVQTYTLPASYPAANNYLLVGSTGGVLSWQAPTTIPTYTVTNASAYGAGSLSLSGTNFIFTPPVIPTQVTVNGTPITLGSSGIVTADASTLTGTTLKSSVVNSSLTSVGTLTNLTTGVITTTVTPGNYQFDVSSNSSQVSLNVGGTVDFRNFSGSILVNCWNSGTVTQYLCGSGRTPTAIGTSGLTNTGTMSSNGGINGYTFTATEAGTHTFFVVRTRPGA